jgi:threonine/homoserine/homoserine lactone efflux protein
VFGVAAYLIFGCAYAFAAAVQPGPFLAYLVSQALRAGWRRTLPMALAPLLSDGPVAVLVLVALSHLSRVSLEWLRCAGGVFVLVLAARAFWAWRSATDAEVEVRDTTRRSVLSAAVVNLLNPGPYLGWSLVMGPLLLKGWRESPGNGIALIVGFYGTMVLTLGAIIVLSAAARRFGPRVGRALVGASAVALGLFGCYQLWAGVRALMGG